MQGFVFDLDNTLFDRYSTIEKIIVSDYQRLRPYFNVVYNTELAIKHAVHTEALFIKGGWESVYEQLRAEAFFNESNTPPYTQFADYVRSKFMEIAVPFPFTAPLLSDLKKAGYKLGIITNSEGDLQRRKISLLGLEDMFDEILVSGEYAQKMCGDSKNLDYWKPNRIIFDEMAKRLEIPADKLYYVGDNPLNDVKGAENAGYVPVWIISKSPWPYENAKLPKHRFYNIDGIRTLI